MASYAEKDYLCSGKRKYGMRIHLFKQSMHRCRALAAILPVGTFICVTLLFGATACSNKGTSVNVLHSLTEGNLAGEPIVLSSDSVKSIETQPGGECLKLDLSNIGKRTPASEIYASYRFVPLETTGKSIVGQVEKILACDGCFCILDRQNANVVLFEEDGRYRCRLGEKGHGAGEHVDAWDIAYDRENNQLVLLDLSGRKLLRYDMHGKLQGVEPMYYLYSGLEFRKDHMICHTGNAHNGFSDILDRCQLVIADRAQMPVAKGFQVSEEARSQFTYATRLRNFLGETYFDDLLSDTIWSIRGTYKVPFAEVREKGKARFTHNERKHMTDRLYVERNEACLHAIAWHVTPRYVSLTVVDPSADRHKQISNLVYSRKSGDYRCCSHGRKPQRLGDHLAGSSIDGICGEDAFIRIVEPMQLVSCLKSEEIRNIMSEEERRLAESLSLDDNPILMIEKLYDF